MSRLNDVINFENCMFFRKLAPVLQKVGQQQQRPNPRPPPRKRRRTSPRSRGSSQSRQRSQGQERRVDLQDPSSHASKHVSNMPIDISKFKHTATNFEAGSISRRLKQWKDLTSDKWILKLVKGYEIDFIVEPWQDFRPKPLRLNRHDQELLDTTLKEFLKLGIIEPCDINEYGFYSTIFPIEKKDHTARIIFDLSELNYYIECDHFKMDTVKKAIELITKNCYFASVDFKNAYYSVLIKEKDRIYLRFIWQGRAYQFVVMAQGLCTAPRAYTKLLKPVLANIRQKGFTVLGYIDDTIFIENSSDEVRQSLNYATDLFDDLGLTISIKKSVFEPTQRIEYLGFILDSRSMTVTLTDAKKQKIYKLASQLLRKEKFTIRALSQFIGNVVAAEQGVFMAPYYYKRLEIYRNKMLVKCDDDYNAVIPTTL
jgi:hypothetical protein